MNFGMLKNMVDNLVKGYKCPFCMSTNINEKNIDIVWAAGNTVNIDMHCPSCNKHFMAKTEVMHMELWNISAEKLEKIQTSLMALKWKLWGNIDVSAEISNMSKKLEILHPLIQEETILEIRKTMNQRGIRVEDLFSGDNTWKE